MRFLGPFCPHRIQLVGKVASVVSGPVGETASPIHSTTCWKSRFERCFRNRCSWSLISLVNLTKAYARTQVSRKVRCDLARFGLFQWCCSCISGDVKVNWDWNRKASLGSQSTASQDTVTQRHTIPQVFLIYCFSKNRFFPKFPKHLRFEA